jgi:hypothetical protein
MNRQISEIRQRNKKVEIDKAWEVSKTRRILIIILTYIFAAITMWLLNLPNPLVNAVIPALGFGLSGLSLNFVKRLWIKMANLQ